MSIKKKLGIAALAALVLVGIYAFVHSSHKDSVAQAAPSNCGGSVTCFTDVAVSNLYSTVRFWLGGSTDSTAVSEIPTIGSCNTASSTLFAVANPFNATSTVTVQSVEITGQATTSSLLVGTSTKSTGLASTDVSATLVNSSNGIATSSLVFTSSGITVGPGTGYLSAGSNTFRTIVVGPSENLVAYSTTTATGAGAANYTPGFSSCSYKATWRR